MPLPPGCSSVRAMTRYTSAAPPPLMNALLPAGVGGHNLRDIAAILPRQSWCNCAFHATKRKSVVPEVTGCHMQAPRETSVGQDRL